MVVQDASESNTLLLKSFLFMSKYCKSYHEITFSFSAIIFFFYCCLCFRTSCPSRLLSNDITFDFRWVTCGKEVTSLEVSDEGSLKVIEVKSKMAAIDNAVQEETV